MGQKRPNPSPAPKSPDKELSELRAYLSIDKLALDDCLIEQPEIFYKVANALTFAVAQRDATKLDLEEARAELDEQFRKQAYEEERKYERKKGHPAPPKLTEGAIQNRIRNTPRIRALENEFLARREEADQWAALKEAFHQRSFMLREIVALQLSQRRDEDAASGGQNAYTRMAARRGGNVR